MLSSWTISSPTIEDLSIIGAPRFGTYIKMRSLLYLVTLLTIPN